MNPEQDEISRNRLINKVTRLGSNTSLLKIVNRHNVNKKPIRTLNRNSYERSEFTKSDLDKALKINELSHSDLKKVAKHRKITNYGELLRNYLFYALLRSEKEPQEHSYLTYANYTTRSELKERINHVRLVTAKLRNKITNKRRKKSKKK